VTVETGVIQYFDEFVDSSDRELILEELEYALWRPSFTYVHPESGDGEYRVTDFRVSETAHQELFSDELLGYVGRVEASLQDKFGVDLSTLEYWQATRYRPGGHFDYHLDAGYWDDHYAGDRVRTFLLFLTTPKAGGGTDFRALDVLVEGVAGRLLVWDNLFFDGSPDYRMMHSGTPLIAGEKVTLVTWERQKTFRLPARVPGEGE
jgi:prolyl 4-hydroxylase